MVTEQQKRVIRAAAETEIDRAPVTDYKPGATKARLIAFGIRILEATQPDSWEMAALEADDEQ